MCEEEGKAESNHYEHMIITSIPHPSKLLDRKTEVRSKGVKLSLREKKKGIRHFTFVSLLPDLELAINFCNSNFPLSSKSSLFGLLQ